MLSRVSAATVLSRGVVRPALAASARSYHKNIVDHYESPRNVGSIDKKDPAVGTGLVGAPACGDVMKLQIRVGADGTVEEAVFKAPRPPNPKPRSLIPAGGGRRPPILAPSLPFSFNRSHV